MAVNISGIDSYLDSFLENKNYKNKIEICEAILDQKYVKGLTDYSKELLALTLEKKIIIAIEKHCLSKQKPSFWRDTKIIAPVMNQKNNFLKNYINLFIHEFNKSNNYINNRIDEIEKFYDEIIYQASKSFRNQLISFPNCEKASIGDLQTALYNTINIPINKTIKIKNKTGNLKEVAIIAGLTTALAVSMLNSQKEIVNEESLVIEQIEDRDLQNSDSNSNEIETNMKLQPKEIFNGYNCNCPIKYQEYIYEMCEKYNIPFNVVITILDNESNGLFNTNGVISDWDDYGLCQINICNHDVIYEKFGFTSEDLLNNPYKNIEAASYLISEICKMYPQDLIDENYENIFGTYNGWILWEEKQTSLEYVENAIKKISTIYNKTNEELFETIYEVDNEKTR